MQLRTAFSFWCFVVAFLSLVGCATSGNAPIESRAAPPSQKINTHVVEPGDTLYSIAWRYEKDYRSIAAINGIKAPYTIQRGQRLLISGPVPSQSSSSTDYSPGSSPASSSDSSVRTTATASRTVSSVDTTSTASSSTSRAAPVQPPVPDTVEGWKWPMTGKVVKTFGSSSLTKGITMDASAQKEVKAAADGVVVYAGSGVRGYGNFLILKHSDLYLSAYAYNDELIANEGDQVRQGQMIAKAGNDQEGLPRLYFEIRKDGKPVDPIRYLPKR